MKSRRLTSRSEQVRNSLIFVCPCFSPVACNMSAISTPFYVRELANPSTGYRARLRLVNPKHLSVEKQGKERCFVLKVTDPATMGCLPDPQEHGRECFFDDLVLSCNLVLERAVISRRTQHSPASSTETENEPRPEAHARDAGMDSISLSEQMCTNEEISHVMQGDVELDEDKISEWLSEILSLRNNDGQAPLNVTNMQKSLDEYRLAMSSFDGLTVFKCLFSALEMSVTYDGHQRRGSSFDHQASCISGIDESEIKYWREFNNRTKHSDRPTKDDRFPDDMTMYRQGLGRLPDTINCLRGAAQKTIVSRLKSI